MEIRPHRIINRRKTRPIKVGKVTVGGNSLVSVQSMTNTLTTDIKGTIDQINSLEKAGADIVESLVLMKARPNLSKKLCGS